MAFGSWRKFRTLKEAREYVKKAQLKGYFVSNPKKEGKFYFVSILTKKGKVPIYSRGI